MIERQVIVCWYTPEERLPEQNKFYICTISAKSKNLSFDHVLANLAWDEDDGWYSMEYDFDELTVHAWCDLEPYGRKRGFTAKEGYEMGKALCEGIMEGLGIEEKEEIAEFEEPKCKNCKYYTGKTGGRLSKTKKYCNRTATINMHPDDFCSRWDKREERADEDSD